MILSSFNTTMKISAMSLFLMVITLLLTSCSAQVEEPAPVVNNPDEVVDTSVVIRYLALGDSYTIGEGVPSEGAYPNQLAKALSALDITVEETKIIARTGWTTDELKADILKRELSNDWNLVSLLIGVNNQFRGRSQVQFKVEFEELLAMAIEFAGGDTSRVFVLSIPDYGVTPFGQNNNTTGRISREIDEFNNIKKEVCSSYQVDYYDITEISRMAADDPSLLAADRLHPSASMYALWVDKVLEDIALKVMKDN